MLNKLIKACEAGFESRPSGARRQQNRHHPRGGCPAADGARAPGVQARAQPAGQTAERQATGVSPHGEAATGRKPAPRSAKTGGSPSQVTGAKAEGALRRAQPATAKPQKIRPEG
ncbi:hypothetical protein D7024_05345 [Desulfofundulus salinus]|uniref:Uncharacterized protein n=1 Tax=Desulfofundulus salinus TaxID=2419843 RepID=A0A494X0Q5_9FIRM|nr:hypothetical protein D7024_05345 [Desulfofundulus salinum]